MMISVKAILAIPKDYWLVRQKIESYGYSFPPITREILEYMAFEAISRGPYLENLQTSRALSQALPAHALRDQLGSCFSRCMGYLIVMAYDVVADRYDLTREEIYDQLSRCFVGFIVGLTRDFPIEVRDLKQEIHKISDIANRNFEEEHDVQKEMSQYFNNGAFLHSLLSEQLCEIGSLLYSPEHHEHDTSLNLSIVASVELGRAIKEIYSLLERYDYTPHGYQQWHYETLILNMIRMGYGQANSVRQKSIDEITLQEYIRIAYYKGNALADFQTSIRCVLDGARFYRIRFHAARFFEQFYLDDLRDFRTDTHDGVLNILHIILLEQGRLAKKLLSLTKQPAKPLIYVSEAVRLALADPSILQIYFKDTFLFQNSRTRAARNDVGQPRYDAENIEAILREVFVNSQAEMILPLETILQQRVALFEEFRTQWHTGNFQPCALLVYKSGIPLRIVNGFIQFIKANREPLVKASTYYQGQIFYYLMLVLIYMQKVSFLLRSRGR